MEEKELVGWSKILKCKKLRIASGALQISVQDLGPKIREFYGAVYSKVVFNAKQNYGLCMSAMTYHRRAQQVIDARCNCRAVTLVQPRHTETLACGTFVRWAFTNVWKVTFPQSARHITPDTLKKLSEIYFPTLHRCPRERMFHKRPVPLLETPFFSAPCLNVRIAHSG